jgi:signal transduction histidine kinase
MANTLADAVERRTAEAEIEGLSAARGRLVAQALDAEERARRRISETLHDSALQDLLAARHDLYALTGRGGDEAALQAAQDGLAAIVRRLREVMSALHPTVLQYGGLEAALSAVADQHASAGGFAPELEVDPAAVGLRDELLLSVARELLSNAARHAGATQVGISVRRDGDAVVLEVADDGGGLSPERLAEARDEGRIGLASARERMEAVGGSLVVEGAAGAGTRVRAEAPAHAALISADSTLDERPDGA